MHVGAVVILEGPPPTREEFSEHIEARLHLVPRYRQKLSFPRFEMGRPLWIDDPRFNIEYHVRHTALPAPGSLAQLRQLAGRIFSQRLDRSKPLWEIWLVQGLSEDRFALISKTHHALVDGVSGVDIATVLFDLTAVPGEPPGPRRRLGPRARALPGRAAGRGREGPAAHPRPAGGPGAGRGPRPGPHAGLGARGRRGRRRGGLGGAEPRARGAAERADRAPPAAVLDREPAGRLQGGQERARRHGERRVPGRGGRRAGALAAQPRRAHRGPGAARAGAGLDPLGRPAGHAGQPDRRAARAAAGVRRRPRRAAADRAPGHAGRQGVQAGPGRRGHLGPGGLRPADAAGGGLAAELLHPAVQRDRDQRARTPVPALPDGARDAPDRARGVPAPGPRAGHRGHELQRQAGPGPAGRLRRHARPRAGGRLLRGVAGGAGRGRGLSTSSS